MEQAKAIAEAVQKNNGRAEVAIFEDEGHGFRLSKNIKASLEKELSFYEDVLHLKANGNISLNDYSLVQSAVSSMQNIVTRCTVQ